MNVNLLAVVTPSSIYHAGMVKSAGPLMSPVVALRFSFIFSYIVLFSLWLVFLLWYGPVVPVVAWKSPDFSLVLELGSEIILG